MYTETKMMESKESSLRLPEIPDSVWGRLGPYIERELGIRMPAEKRHMLQNRLLRRLKRLGLKTFEEYSDYLFSEEGRQNETTHFINEVTTNKTFFFREYRHFEFLSDKIIPAYLAKPGAGREPFRVWSAGCSTGEEVYSIACIIEEFMRTEGVSFPYEILGTDISTRVLWHAHDAIYDAEQIGMISREAAHRYFLAGKDENSNLRRVAPEIRSRVKLRKLNFMDETYPITQQYDAIFCRNVLIYFSREDIVKIVSRSLRHLRAGGHLIVGLSDSIYSAANTLQRVEPSVFLKPR